MKKQGNQPRNLELAATGIAGFDVLAGGGLPRNRTTLLLGTAGAGKTVFATQSLVQAARNREPGVFVAFEEPEPQVISNAASMGWVIGSAKTGVTVLDAQLHDTVLTDGAFDLIGLLASVGALAKKTGARRVVFDGIDVLLDLLADPVLQRRELFRLRDWVSQNQLTALVTAKVGSQGQLPENQAFLEFLADAVVRLDHRVVHRTSLRAMRIAKVRGAPHSGDQIPFVIGPDGIEVLSRAKLELDHDVSDERVSSGVERLDQMLGGGYFRNSSILVSGAPGTSKSTLAGAFVLAACQRKEPTLMVSLDEAAEQIVRNLRSVSIDLRPHLRSGLLEIRSLRARASNAAEEVSVIQRLATKHGARCLVVDPISALAHGGGAPVAEDAEVRLIDFTKSSGVTLLATSLMVDALGEETASGVSTLADTWIHLQYAEAAGERNRGLTIIKSRGSAHSNQVRELVLRDEGVELADVYSSGGEVLMGTLRWERETEERAERERAERRAAIAHDEAKARVEQLRAELELQQARFEQLQADTAAERERDEQRKASIERIRSSSSEAKPARKKGRTRRQR